MTTGEKIRKYRKIAGMTQKQLAEVCEIPMLAVSNYEIGKYNCPPDRLERIAEVLGVDVSELAEDESEDVIEIKHQVPYTGMTPEFISNSNDRQRLLIQMSSDMDADEIRRTIAYLQGLLTLKGGNE